MRQRPGCFETPPARYASGWYPDPTGRFDLRFHNGCDWTADVARDGERFVDPAGIGPGPAAPSAAERRSGVATAAILGGDFLLAKASEVAAPLGEEAVTFVRRHEIDVVMMDVDMPGIGAIEAPRGTLFHEYVLDEAGSFEQRCNLAMVELEPIAELALQPRAARALRSLPMQRLDARVIRAAEPDLRRLLGDKACHVRRAAYEVFFTNHTQLARRHTC